LYQISYGKRIYKKQERINLNFENKKARKIFKFSEIKDNRKDMKHAIYNIINKINESKKICFKLCLKSFIKKNCLLREIVGAIEINLKKAYKYCIGNI